VRLREEDLGGPEPGRDEIAEQPALAA
jgi:hypothetical protein